MKFGVEIECWSPVSISGLLEKLSKELPGLRFTDHKERKTWSIVEDHSLTASNSPFGFDGVELVSPVLNTEKGDPFGEIVKLCGALQKIGCVVDGNCGLHVHLDARGMSLGRVKRIFKRYTSAEPAIDLMVSANRKSNSFAKTGKGILKDVVGSENFDDLDGKIYERYRKVNLCALGDHGTIEFRQHEGTINGFTIVDWVGFLVGFVQATKLSNQQTEAATKATAKYQIFSVIHTNGPMTVDKIAELLCFPKTTVVWHIRRLRTLGLVHQTSYGDLGYVSARKEISDGAEELVEMEPQSIWEGVPQDIKSRLIDKSILVSGGSRTVLEKLLGAKA